MKDGNRPYTDIRDPFTGDPMRVFSCAPDEITEHALSFLDEHDCPEFGARVVSPSGWMDVCAGHVRETLRALGGRVSYVGVNRDAGRYFIGRS